MLPINDDQDDQGLDIDTEEGGEVVVETEHEDDVLHAIPATNPDFDPAIEEEIKKVMIVEEEEPTPKAKAQMLPDKLITKELEPEDWFDKGSI